MFAITVYNAVIRIMAIDGLAARARGCMAIRLGPRARGCMAIRLGPRARARDKNNNIIIESISDKYAYAVYSTYILHALYRGAK